GTFLSAGPDVRPRRDYKLSSSPTASQATVLSRRRWVLFEAWARIGHVGLRAVAHRRVGHELADLLSTATGGRDLRGPLQRCLPRGHVEDREPSVELLGLRVSAGGDRTVNGHHDGIDLLSQPRTDR